MSEIRDLTGQRFGHLVVLHRGRDYVSPSGVHRVKWVCKCDCGSETEVISSSLLRGSTTTCGFCYTRGAKLTTSDGETHTVSEWALLTDISHHTLWSRIRAGWEPDEVVGRRPHENRNCTTLATLFADGHKETHTVAEWSKLTGINSHTLWTRLRAGWPIEKALTPKEDGTRHSMVYLYTVYNNRENHSLVCRHSDVHEASKAMGVTVETFRGYLMEPAKKWTIEREWLQ